MSEHERELLHIREAADKLGVTQQTIHRQIQDGELGAVRLGANGRYRIRQDALDAFLRPAEPRP